MYKGYRFHDPVSSGSHEYFRPHDHSHEDVAKLSERHGWPAKVSPVEATAAHEVFSSKLACPPAEHTCRSPLPTSTNISRLKMMRERNKLNIDDIT